MRAARRLGTELAQRRFRLVVGDWKGIDELVGLAYVEALAEGGESKVGDWVMQVRRIDSVSREQWTLPAAEHLDAHSDEQEYDLPAARCDACVIIGGLGGAGESARRVRTRDKPVFPLPMTEGDSRDVFHEIMRDWSLFEMRGVTPSQFVDLYTSGNFGVDSVLRMLRAVLTKSFHTFISYRRTDVPVAAGRLYADLIEVFGPRGVYMDVESIKPGATFPAELESAIRAVKVMVVAVGPRWKSNRLREESDWVSREILGAKRAGALVVPVMFEGAALQNLELPDALKWLHDCQMLSIGTQYWRRETHRLAERIEDALTAG